jgi:hypothetical protein
VGVQWRGLLTEHRSLCAIASLAQLLLVTSAESDISSWLQL